MCIRDRYYNGSNIVTANPVVPRTFYQFDEEENSKKERIQLVKPEFVEDFVENYERRLRRGRTVEIGISPANISME